MEMQVFCDDETGSKTVLNPVLLKYEINTVLTLLYNGPYKDCNTYPNIFMQ